MEPAEKRGLGAVSQSALPHRDGGQLAIAKKQLGPQLSAHRTHDTALGLIAEFLRRCEQRLQSLRKSQHSGRDLADEVLAFLRDLIRFETGVLGLEDGMPAFLDSLWASPVIRQQLLDLSRRAAALLHPRAAAADLDRYRAEAAAYDLADILSWYSRRKLSLARLHEEFDGEEDTITPITVVHDVEWCGARGMEVVTSLRLVGHEFDSLWLKARVMSNGHPVRVKPQWRFWIDDAEGQGGHPGLREDFASMVALAPQTQRLIVDTVRLFIPYSALDLAPGRHEVDVELGLFDARHRILLEAACPCILQSPTADVEDRPVPAPMALGMWPSDPVTGDRLSRVRIAAVSRQDGAREAHYAKVEIDLDLMGHHHSSVMLECRFMTLDGDLIDGETSRFTARDGTFCAQLELRPQRAVSRYYDVELMIPLVALALDTGRYDLYCEISAILPNKRVLCGTMQRVQLTIPALDGARRRADPLDARVQSVDTGVCLNGLEIDTESRFGAGERLRVETFLTHPDWKESIYRVLVHVEPVLPESAGAEHDTICEPFVRSLIVGGNEGAKERSQVFVFDTAELCDAWRLEGTPDFPCTVRISVLTLDDRTVLKTARNVRIPARERAGAAPTATHAAVEMIDVALSLKAGVSRPVFSVTMNVANFLHDPSGCAVYGELCELPENAHPAGQGDRVPSELQGQLATLDFNAVLLPLETAAGWFQTRVDLECEVRPNESPLSTRCLKVMLFSKSGRLLQVVYQPLTRDPAPSCDGEDAAFVQ